MSLDRLHSPQAISRSRRNFLKGSLGLLAAPRIFGLGMPAGISLARPAQKTVLVTFGGGARDDETFAEDGQQKYSPPAA